MLKKIKEACTGLCMRMVCGLLRLIYAVLKLLPVRDDKVLFCSRQSSEIPLDFRMLQDVLEADGLTCVNCCIRVGDSLRDQIRFGQKILLSMYHLATCRVCVLDSYWPAVCLLKHKKELKVIQIWHALGKIKQSGYQTLDRENGRSAAAASLLGMHRNYDYIIAGARYFNPYYCASFGAREEQLLNYGLPRIDYLLATREANIRRFREAYPQSVGRRIILYVPTFRKSAMADHQKRLIRAMKGTDFLLLLKPHPIHRETSLQLREQSGYVLMPDEWDTIDLYAVSDYVITDYSAAALEAAVLRKPTYYWTYDYEEYTADNGLNLDLKAHVGRYLFTDIDDLIRSIREEPYDEAFMEDYCRKFLPDHLGSSTEQICNLIRSFLPDEEPASDNVFRAEEAHLPV